MARFSKDPAVRKKEIIEAAITLFAEKGYEKTSMSDIANKIGIAQGLCYRYFPSKEALFDFSLHEYAQMIADKTRPILCDKTLSLAQKIEMFPSISEYEPDTNPYYNIFHGEESRRIHDLLALQICELMVPIVASAIEAAHINGEISISDYETIASFCVFGQLGILLNDKIDNDKKREKINLFFTMLMKN